MDAKLHFFPLLAGHFQRKQSNYKSCTVILLLVQFSHSHIKGIAAVEATATVIPIRLQFPTSCLADVPVEWYLSQFSPLQTQQHCDVIYFTDRFACQRVTSGSYNPIAITVTHKAFKCPVQTSNTISTKKRPLCCSQDHIKSQTRSFSSAWPADCSSSSIFG